MLDAAASGAASGMQLALNVGAMLLAFIALIALLPILLVYPAIQGELIKGMVVGGVKG